MAFATPVPVLMREGVRRASTSSGAHSVVCAAVQTPKPSLLPNGAVPATAPERLAGRVLTDAQRKQYSRMFIDERATREANTPDAFPYSPEELIELAKYATITSFGANDPDILADDFYFKGPVVGPVYKDDFVKVFGSFNLRGAFPDAADGMHDFVIDPFNPRTVWSKSKFVGTHEGKLAAYEGTGKLVEASTQIGSLTFNAEGKLEKLTGGYIMDRDLGNCGGLGGVFGLFYAIGKPLPFPEGQPWKTSWRYWLFDRMGTIFRGSN